MRRTGRPVRNNGEIRLSSSINISQTCVMVLCSSSAWDTEGGRGKAERNSSWPSHSCILSRSDRQRLTACIVIVYSTQDDKELST